MNIFDRSLKSLHKNRILLNHEHASIYFNDLGIKPMINRLSSIKGKEYVSGCYIGPMSHLFLEALGSNNFLGIRALTILDSCKSSLNNSLSLIPKRCPIKVTGLSLDEELWSFPENYFDIIINNLQLHWINQVHFTMEKWLRSLKPDGTLIGVTLGGDSLQELRISMALAEQEREGGVSTHVSPMLHITDIGQVLIRLNYKLITTNADSNTLYFDDIFCLMNFLQATGENNAALSARSSISRETFIAAGAIYKHLFKENIGEFKGKIPATFELMHYIAWKDHPSQQKPLRPGTKGVDIKTLAEEIDDSDMEQLEIKEVEDEIQVNKIIKK
jgi:NADH dehydrogenase [ubiquinone] 1 alpha subcomplex assembly factor 5